ncbi:YALIA101S07e05380g1_1 [Yarrowia lipolytica]|nr:Vacuolar protein sorting-associated protein 36 [Yarrowia lipolytica]SEI35611.1 YALIA101S07e05380g1_1 [Yarrowia lipolytica]
MWTIPELNNSLRPVLFNNESDVIVTDHVGLYENKQKVPNFQNGRIYLTSERLIYVDKDSPKKFTISIPLKAVSEVEHSGGFYLKTSPKITCFLKPEETSSSKDSGHHAVDTTWICIICFMSNTLKSWREGNEIPKCSMCGVKPSIDIIDNAVKATKDSSKMTKKKATVETNECPRCTFKNHPSMLNCEMCGAVIKAIQAQTVRCLIPNNSPVVAFRLSFRKGGDKLFLEKLTSCINKEAVSRTSEGSRDSKENSRDASVTPGLSGLQLSGQQRLSANDSLMESALVDLQALMTQGKQVLTLAKSFQSLIEAEGGTSTTITVSSSFDAADSLSEDVFYQELSRDLSEFLHSGVLDKEGGIISLFDLYALYNRSRGYSLVSPNDLYKACAQMESLGLPVKMRRYKNGFLAVQEKFKTNDALTKQLISWIKTVDASNTKGVSTLGVCSKFKWSVGVAEEELQYAEEKGLLCRDEHVTGLRYFVNIMCT